MEESFLSRKNSTLGRNLIIENYAKRICRIIVQELGGDNFTQSNPLRSAVSHFV